jgi:hypothetical protein
MQQVAPASTCLYLENLATLAEMQDANERAEIGEDVKEECAKFGQVLGVIVPIPTEAAQAAGEPGRCYARFNEQVRASTHTLTIPNLHRSQWCPSSTYSGC